MLDNIEFILGRKNGLFDIDIKKYENKLTKIINSSSFLIIGGAGSIGSSVTFEILKREPKLIHVVDISENNTVELVRNIRSSLGYIKGEFKTFSIDCNSNEFDSLVENNNPYDYVFNLSALKHVRSESDPYTLMRMTMTNIINTIKTLKITKSNGSKKYFCVSSDKATNPVNMMGASKRIMEIYLSRESKSQKVSTARFANIAFSDGSLLHGFNQRYLNEQPISAPSDVKRYFMTPKESGELCLLSGLLAKNKEIFFPKLNFKEHLIKFSDIAIKYLKLRGFEAYLCENEDEARQNVKSLIQKKLWPCYFFLSDTTGEKDYEEFYDKDDNIDLIRFKSIGILENNYQYDEKKLKEFLIEIENLRYEKIWTKTDILNLYFELIPNFNHIEKEKYLNDRM